MLSMDQADPLKAIDKHAIISCLYTCMQICAKKDVFEIDEKTQGTAVFAIKLVFQEL